MTITPKVLWGEVPVANAPGSIYVSPALTTTVINRAVFTNVSAGAVTLTVWVVRSGGSAVNSDILIGAASGGQSMAAGPSEPYVAASMAALVLNPGDAIFAQASASASINTVGSGWWNT